jgi:hypothetical protein
MKENSIVSIVTAVWAVQPGILFCRGARDFSLSQNVNSPIQWLLGGNFAGSKAAGASD